MIGSLFLGMNYELKNRHMHLDYKEEYTDLKDDLNDLNHDLNQREIQLLSLIHSNSELTLKELGTLLNISDTTVKRTLSKLQKEGIVKREGSSRKGKWIVIEENAK